MNGRRIKYYHIAAAVFLLAAGLMHMGVCITEDLYHYFKYGSYHLYNYQIFRNYVRVVLFLSASTFYCFRKRLLFVFSSAGLVLYFAKTIIEWPTLFVSFDDSWSLRFVR